MVDLPPSISCLDARLWTMMRYEKSIPDISLLRISTVHQQQQHGTALLEDKSCIKRRIAKEDDPLDRRLAPTHMSVSHPIDRSSVYCVFGHGFLLWIALSTFGSNSGKPKMMPQWASCPATWETGSIGCAIVRSPHRTLIWMLWRERRFVKSNKGL